MMADQRIALELEGVFCAGDGLLHSVWFGHGERWITGTSPVMTHVVGVVMWVMGEAVPSKKGLQCAPYRET